VTVSAAQAETVALSTTVRLVKWALHLIEEIGIARMSLPVTIFLDNDATRHTISGTASQGCTRDLEVKHYANEEAVTKGTISLHRISTKENTADVLTKSLPRTAHQTHTIGLGLVA
jgi:hypothetical protein